MIICIPLSNLNIFDDIENIIEKSKHCSPSKHVAVFENSLFND